MSLNDMADRAPGARLDDGEVIDLGGKRVRFVYTPHVPHGWEAGVMFEETSNGALLCGDLFTHTGDGPAMEHEIRRDGPCRALGGEEMFHAVLQGPDTAPDAAQAGRPRAHHPGPDARLVVRRRRRRVALRDLADAYEARFTAAVPV